MKNKSKFYINSFNELVIGTKFYFLIDDGYFSFIRECEFIKDKDGEYGLFLNCDISIHTTHQFDCYEFFIGVFNDEIDKAIFINKEDCLKKYFEKINCYIKKYKGYNNYLIPDDIKLEDIDIGDEFYFNSYVYYQKVKIMNKISSMIVFYKGTEVELDSIDINFFNDYFFKEEKHAKARIFENFCYEMSKYEWWKYYEFDEGEIIYYIDDLKLKEKVMKKDEKFNSDKKPFLIKSYAKNYLIEKLENEIDKIKRGECEI